ncbi:hypothetical protein L3Y34_013710 [Caenorhabditis briggsae]|uniref:Zinc finger PHD-type domain-containing protein n=2 Tax=Caenorhabditis briggsae TaxID=6238 RepID=A0AAE8ZVL6_CAEBR|nr:hypothetical protein L3Y34_013710 [Caenorhabditis briggsae]
MADQDLPNWPVQASVANNPNQVVHRPIPLIPQFMINGNPFMHPNIQLAPTFEANQLVTWHMHQYAQLQQQVHQQQVLHHRMLQQQTQQPQNLELVRRGILMAPSAPNVAAILGQGAPVATSQAAVLQYDPIQQILQHDPSLIPFFLQLQLQNQQVHGNVNNQVLPVSAPSAEQSPAMSASEVSNSSLSPLEGTNAIAASGLIDDSEADAASRPIDDAEANAVSQAIVSSDAIGTSEADAAPEAMDALEAIVDSEIQSPQDPSVIKSSSEHLAEIAVTNGVPKTASEERGNSKKNQKRKAEEAEMEIQLNAAYEERKQETKTGMSSFLREESQKVHKEARKSKETRNEKTEGVDRSSSSTPVLEKAAEAPRNEESHGDTLETAMNSEEMKIEHGTAASPDESSTYEKAFAPTPPIGIDSAPTPLGATEGNEFSISMVDSAPSLPVATEGIAMEEQEEEKTNDVQEISQDVDHTSGQNIQMEMLKSDGDKEEEEEEEEEDLKLTSRDSSQPIPILDNNMVDDDQDTSTSQSASKKAKKVHKNKKRAEDALPVKRGRPRKVKKEVSPERLRSPSFDAPRPKRSCRAKSEDVVAQEEDEVISDEEPSTSDTSYEECGVRCALQKYCFTRSPAEEVTLEWIGCSHCPRWYHVFCLKMKNEKYTNEDTGDVLDCCNAVVDGSEFARAKMGRTFRKFHGFKKGRRPAVGDVKKRKGEFKYYDYKNK